MRVRGTDVTVVIPTITGREAFLSRAIASVKNQSIPVGDVVVVCDEERRGAAWARNEGLKRVTTDYLLWLDDDDELTLNSLKIHVRALNGVRPRPDLVYGYAAFPDSQDPLAIFHPDGAVIARPIHHPWDVYAEWSLRNRGNFILVTYLVRAQLVRDVGGFPDQLGFDWGAKISRDCEDYGLLIKLLDAGAKFHHVDARTFVYHVHGGNTAGHPGGQ
jgi:glycosyltransferase involved in cell wall biosynthesis